MTRIQAALVAAALLAAAPADAADTLSQTDAAFVAKVSQGGMFEVAASMVAERKAQAQNVKDLANTEVHDHQLVGDKLKSIVAGRGITLGSSLNAAFSSKVDQLNRRDGAAFDNAYVAAMDDIHAKDGAAFQAEAKNGTDPALRAFAAETSLIVKRHIGALHAPGTATPS